MNYLDRQRAVAATRNHFAGREIDWREVDCARMLVFHLRQMGHRPPPLPRYSTAKGALRALRKVGGFASVLDTFLPRIPALLMLPGDVGVMPGTTDEGEPMESAIVWESRKGFGWAEGHAGLVNMTPNMGALTAWRA